MIDFDLIRQQPDRVKENIVQRFQDPNLVDQLLAVDSQWKALLAKVEPLRAERNLLAQTKATAEANSERLQALKRELEQQESAATKLAETRRALYLRLPNLLDAEVPIGQGETANKVIRKVGQPKIKSGLAHEDLMTAAGWLNLEVAAQVSGSRFRYLLGSAAQTHLRLVNRAVELASLAGFTLVIPPVLTKAETMEKSGFFPGGESEMFGVDEKYYLTGSSEPLLIAYGAAQAQAKSALPIRLVGFSSCFRREAGSYGQDVKGMFRQHQFDKVELVVLCSPEDSESEHQKLVALQEQMVQLLDLPYQVVLVGSGDLEVKATKRFDLETWFPSAQKYRETHSASSCGDYQARRFGLKNTHTLNATLYTERLLLALIENSQHDGHITLPSSVGVSQ